MTLGRKLTSAVYVYTSRGLDVPVNTVVPPSRLGVLSYIKQCGGVSNTRELQKADCGEKGPHRGRPDQPLPPLRSTGAGDGQSVPEKLARETFCSMS